MPIHRTLMTMAIMATVSLATPWRPQAAEPVTAAARTVGLQRITLLVSDIDKSVDFYQRAGLLKGADTSHTDTDQGGVYGAADLPLTADSKRSRLVVMQGADGRGALALLWYERPPLPSARGNLVGLGIGDVIIGVEVADIQTAYNRLGQVGTRFQRTPVPFTQTAADGAQHTGQHLLAYDPDGHLVEVSQMDRR
jgi:catechol 2,3-dioxygenase-like lactoylglutathione lyase family enzyme